MVFKIIHLGAFGNVGRRLPPILHKLVGTEISYTALDLTLAPSSIDIPEGVEYDYIQMTQTPGIGNQVVPSHCLRGLTEMHEPGTFDMLINTGGGYSYAPLPTVSDGSDDIDSFLDAYDGLRKSCFDSNVAAIAIASKFLKPSAPLITTCAASAIAEAPHEDAYNIIKGAHRSLMAGRPDVLTFFPGTIDTEGNREAMPDADRTEWNDPDAMLEEVVKAALEGKRGELKIETKDGVTSAIPI